MATLKSARNPRWNTEHTMITLDVVFVETQETLGEIPFSSSPNDSAAYGRDIYERAYAGEFGDIAEPVEIEVLASVMLKRDAASSLATAKINSLQTSLEIIEDTTELEGATNEQTDRIPALKAEFKAWRTYRVRLAQIESQSGFPLSVEWPEPPSEPFIYSAPSDSTVQNTGT
ncbi:phage tail assembly chaperone [Pseudomonas syringae]|uniref:phage tail assembly chaperone n=1 Tax=Pseudomonas syringae TaxID=317 RepID=UPI000CD35EFD|nr:phage tail assembly chaperone [Pseudomonas syringae]MCF5200360.1 phage tail protein [Pseudomonas syringae]MCF5209562.1 phage tail protein [Pseudomonas syringae]MCF5213310.1 phage tail protein [Pseudomonas syringae]MCF5219718.1 phage tail protein [Pseudomonas syringae]MCF5266054.1 phage tail protein [Pseudomonas syringae]